MATEDQDRWEQTAHALMGFAAAFAFALPILLARELWWQWPPATEREPVLYVSVKANHTTGWRLASSSRAALSKLGETVEYLSSRRSDDMRRDLAFTVALGYWLGHIAQVGVVVWLVT